MADMVSSKLFVGKEAQLMCRKFSFCSHSQGSPAADLCRLGGDTISFTSSVLLSSS